VGGEGDDEGLGSQDGGYAEENRSRGGVADHGCPKRQMEKEVGARGDLLHAGEGKGEGSKEGAYHSGEKVSLILVTGARKPKGQSLSHFDLHLAA